MNKKGFTLMELLATIVVLSIVAIVAIPTIGNIVSEMSNKVYIESEKTLARTGQNYFLTNNELLPVELGESSFIKLDQLVEVAAAEKIIDPKDQKECEGYLIVSKPTANSYEYDPYIKCGDNYSTPLYDLESAMEPSILILGENPVSLLMGQTYTDEGAKARDKYGNNLTSQIVVNNPVNINVGGVYQVTYTATDKDGVSKTVSRTVNILDTIPPVITVTGANPATLYQDGMYVDPGYTATDNSDGNITARVVVTHNITPGLPGNYTVTYTVADNSGNTDTKTRSVTVVADPAPTVAFGTNGNATWGTTRSTTVTVSDVGSGLNTSTLEYQWTTSTTTPTEASFTTAFTNGATITTPAGASGTYYLWIIAKDVNNHTTITRTNVFNLDNGTPTITANNASSSWFTSRTTTITGTDNLAIAEIRYQWNTNGMNAACTSGGTVTTTGTALTVPAGSNQLFLCIRDNAGTTATYASGADMFRVDNANPTVTFGTNGNATWGTSRSTTVTVADTQSGVNTTTLEYQWTTSTTAPTEASFTTTFTNGATITSPAGVSGTYYLWILAKDNAARTSIISSNVFNLDNGIPTITANNASSSWFSTRTTTVTGTDNLAIAEIRYQWNTNGMNAACTTGGAVTTTGTALTVPGGSNQLFLCIRDNAGNTATYASGLNMFRVDGADPTVVFGTNGNATWGTSRSTTVTVSDTESGVNTATLEYQWTTSTTAPSEASFSTSFSNGGTISTPANQNGAYYLWILGKDNNGNTMILRSNVFNLDNAAPVISFGTNGNVNYAKTASTTVTVTDAGFGVNASSLKYLWTTSSTQPSDASFTTTFTSGAVVTSPTGLNVAHYLWITAKDTNGITSYLRSAAFNLDNTNPVISVTGANPYTIYFGDSFSEPGRSATDNSGFVPTITNTIIPTAIGSYTITYTATDQAGNTDVKTRSFVIVQFQLAIEYLIVAGGGGGGMNHAGGGGAGGLLQGSTPLSVTSYSITVGNGGAAATTQASPASNGGNSVALGLTAIGGGGGGCRNDTANNSPGSTGGSGGGGGGAQTPYPTNWNPGSGTSGQGNAGGRAVDLYGGGGGGAGGVGTNATSGVCGDGGAGIQSSISGTAKYYAGGGGGGSGACSGSGGSGIGGNGSYTNAFNGTNPVANTGSGGGGGGPAYGIGSAGASGIVIIKYYGAQKATGGTITTLGGYTIHTFTSSDNFIVGAFSAEYLIVAGGGGGGMNHAGGGGAGGLLQGSTQLSITSYSITIGNGGAAATVQTSAGSNGGNSTAFGLTAIGGGGGGNRNDVSNSAPGVLGGSGGGGGGAVTTYSTNWNPGSGTSGQGNSGGRAVDLYGGGGGGAGGTGANASSGVCGSGGAGLQSSISGTAKYYAAGGGGGSGACSGSGGSGIGGNGSYTNAFNGTNPVANTGSGGGGGGPAYGIGSAGASGIVIIKYYGAQKATGGTITTLGGYTIHTFTSSGTLTVTSN